MLPLILHFGMIIDGVAPGMAAVRGFGDALRNELIGTGGAQPNLSPVQQLLARLCASQSAANDDVYDLCSACVGSVSA